ncbi:MAG TPA: BMP family ABC transporter substrate-binding protein, partial [Aggregatilineales bacterium]|nr:BMP family ABC transporter substrate-binding protein [Aggregatilineales bacterium]
MSKRFMLLSLSTLMLALLVMAGSASSTSAQGAATPAPTMLVATAVNLKVGLITDVGGIDDRSFNASAWKGVQQATQDYGVQSKYLQSKQQTDYEKNL